MKVVLIFSSNKKTMRVFPKNPAIPLMIELKMGKNLDYMFQKTIAVFPTNELQMVG